MYIFFRPKILLSINVFLSFYVFSIDFSLDRIKFYVIPIIGLIFILEDAFDIFFSCYVLTVGFVYPYDATV